MAMWYSLAAIVIYGIFVLGVARLLNFGDVDTEDRSPTDIRDLE